METKENEWNSIQGTYYLSPTRQLTNAEKMLVWQKPQSHRESAEELRICKEIKRNWHRGEMKMANILLEGDAGSGKTQLAKALSADFGLPYTKVTCFADMDKSDIIGAILPVLSDEGLEKIEQEDKRALKAIYENDGFNSITEILMEALGVTSEQAVIRMKQLLKLTAEKSEGNVVEYRFYPSEIVRAYQNGYLLEIQEPTVIRDAAVLMALNSALELDGSINLPTEIITRHQDFIAVITTNRNYVGCRPLNESLRDRVQHTEKMDLPTKEVMIERTMAKTGYMDQTVLNVLADAIILLDETARVNAIKGVAGMRSFFYWADAVAFGNSIKESLYHKVIYKITTDPEEISILEDALQSQGLLDSIDELEIEEQEQKSKDSDAVEIKTEGNIDDAGFVDHQKSLEEGIALKKSAESEDSASAPSKEITDIESPELGEDGAPQYHQANPEAIIEEQKQKEREFRKKLNQEARVAVANSIHNGVKLIVHRPDYDSAQQEEYKKLSKELLPVVNEIARKTLPLLEHEISSEFLRNQNYGSKFQGDSIAKKDFRNFAKKLPPTEAPSLVVGIRIDESASMSAFGRLEAAKRAVLAVFEFCKICDIPVLIYGDTADKSKFEQMSVFAYTDFDKKEQGDCFRLMNIQARSNNRDGMALRIMAERLVDTTQQTKLLISISDGQPKAMPDYTNRYATDDMKQTIFEYERKGVTFLAAAIGQDKEIISEIYGKDRFLDITDLKEFPAKLVRIISRYL